MDDLLDDLLVYEEKEAEEAPIQEAQLIDEYIPVSCPNLTHLVGEDVAQSLIREVGSLKALSELDSSALQTIGKNSRNLSSVSHASSKFTLPHFGFIIGAPLVVSTPQDYRVRVIRTLSGKATLAARIDAANAPGTKPGSLTTKPCKPAPKIVNARIQIEDKIQKWQAPPPQRQIRPLDAPGDSKRPRRGGRRWAKRKRLQRMGEAAQAQARIPFGKLSGRADGERDLTAVEVRRIMHSARQEKLERKRGKSGVSAGLREISAKGRDEREILDGLKSTLTVPTSSNSLYYELSGPGGRKSATKPSAGHTTATPWFL
eukprot:gnl/Dysnectes_brevis/7727_a13248_183.p1 GENE.gnl/Dysnectes_brevis/7727_a13248_183~~gnl/Dysnectes_brevis/7727_a13248_183.p1  ORF type:complete len:316 (+),score=15.14 gnl/Dysnectes_brevis/7727_a13248_183:580-1527(+)